MRTKIELKKCPICKEPLRMYYGPVPMMMSCLDVGCKNSRSYKAPQWIVDIYEVGVRAGVRAQKEQIKEALGISS